MEILIFGMILRLFWKLRGKPWTPFGSGGRPMYIAGQRGDPMYAPANKKIRAIRNRSRTLPIGK
jgi:hypothetical protein